MSPFAGASGIDRCKSYASIPQDADIRRVRIKASKNWVNEIKFLDANESLIAEVKADSGVGDWHDVILTQGEHIIGY